MLGSVIVVAAIGVVAIGSLSAAAFMDGGLRGGDRTPDEQDLFALLWHPPLTRGRDLVEWARRQAAAAVRRNRDGRVAELVRQIQTGANRAMLPLASERELARPVPCPAEGQGLVTVSAPEAIAIGQALRKTRSRKQRARIRATARDNVDGGRVAAPGERWSRAACPLQGEDCVCVVFGARPIGCRPFHAGLVSKRLGHGPLYQGGHEACEGVARQVGAGIEMGLTEGLAELGLDGARYELNAALLSVLDDDDHEARWWSGEPLDA